MSNEQGIVRNSPKSPAQNGNKGVKPKMTAEQRAAQAAAHAERQAKRAAKAAAEEAENEAEKLRNFYSNRRIRKGKTARDRANGVKNKNLENKYTRVSWQQDSKADVNNFPVSSCNGKRNRYQVTGKDGQTIYLKTSGSPSGKGKR